MLQQTTTAVVEKYFQRFVKRFPTVHELADAPEEEILYYWEGLGYYRRARQLHQAARIIVRDHGGIVPDSVEHLMQLPGVGRYTAGAIVSLAFNRPAPILEANTRRLFSRWLRINHVRQSQKDARLWEFAEYLLPKRGPAVINQALMDVGHDICLPKQPRCAECPISRFCRAFQNGKTFPITENGIPPTQRHEVALLVERDHHIWMVRHAAGDRWAGLWDLPRLILSENPDHIPPPATLDLDSIVQSVRLAWPFGIRVINHLFRLRYQITRYRVVLDCFLAEIAQQSEGLDPIMTRLPTAIEEQCWIPLAETQRLPVPSSARKILTFWLSRREKGEPFQ